MANQGARGIRLTPPYSVLTAFVFTTPTQFCQYAVAPVVADWTSAPGLEPVYNTSCNCAIVAASRSTASSTGRPSAWNHWSNGAWPG
jgi:hypothetical protein